MLLCYPGIGYYIVQYSALNLWSWDLTSLFSSLAGEIFELKAELNNEKKEKRKEAVKKVIAAMTVGKDVR